MDMAVTLSLVLMACVFTTYTKDVVNLMTMSSTTTTAATTAAKATSATTTTTATTAKLDISSSTSLQEEDVVNLMTMSSTTTTAATTAAKATSATTTTTATTAKLDISSSTSLQEEVCPLCKDAPNVVYIAVGAAVGGLVVGCVITAIVFIMWMRRRNTSTEDNATAPNIYASPSHYEDMEHQYSKVDRQYVNTVEVSGADSLDAVNTEDQAGNADYYNTTGQHQHPDGL